MTSVSPQHLIDRAYGAALDDALWQPWLDELVPALGGAGGTFIILDDRMKQPDRLLTRWGNPKYIEEYQSAWCRFDPQVKMALSIGQAATYLDTDHVDPADPGTAEYLKWARSGGLDHWMTGVMPLGDGRRVGVSILRHVADGHTPREEHLRFRTIFAETARAMELGFRHGEMLADSYWEGLAAGQSGRAALLLDERGSVVRLTAAPSPCCPGMTASTSAAVGCGAPIRATMMCLMR
jgi:hypothetical protein